MDVDMLNGHTVDQSVQDKTKMLDKLAMEYETSVQAFGAEDYLREFYDFYEIKNRDHKLIPSPDTFYETLKEVSGDDVWEPIAKKTESLFGVPARIPRRKSRDTRTRRGLDTSYFYTENNPCPRILLPDIDPVFGGEVHAVAFLDVICFQKFVVLLYDAVDAKVIHRMNIIGQADLSVNERSI